jgi:hypothetical protein
MLFISVFTYEPEKRDEVLKRRAESLFTPEGGKCLGQWSYTSGGRVFTLFEVDNTLTLTQWAHAWNDLGKFETFPVVDTEELMKAMAAKK